MQTERSILLVHLASSLFCLVGLVKSGGNSSYNNSLEYNQMLEKARVNSVPQYYRVEIGGTARFQCQIRNLGGMMRVWKNGTRVVYVGDLKIRSDTRITLENDAMIIAGVAVWDSGWYSCELENDIDQPFTIKYHLQVLDPPVILDLDGEQTLTSVSGSTISLSCRANGQPKPSITWSREGLRNEILGNETELTLTNIGRPDSGNYKCTATNGVGHPVSKSIHLEVLYLPEIVPVRRKVHGHSGASVNISCEVWSNPQATIHWESTAVKQMFRMTNVKTETGSVISTLHVQIYNETYLGNYSCGALNRFGESTDSVLIRGNPDVPVVQSQVLAEGQHVYTLVWEARSDQNITKYQIMYRKLPDSWIVYAWDIVEYPVPELPSSKYQLTVSNLQPDSAYTIIIKAYNGYGWSDISEDFLFYTRGKETHPLDSPVLDTDVSKSSPPLATPPLLCALICIIYLILPLYRE